MRTDWYEGNYHYCANKRTALRLLVAVGFPTTAISRFKEPQVIAEGILSGLKVFKHGVGPEPTLWCAEEDLGDPVEFAATLSAG